MYKTFEVPEAKPKPKSQPMLFKQNSKIGLEEGLLWQLSSSKFKSQKRLGLIEDVEKEDSEAEDNILPEEFHAKRTTTPLPIIGVKVPLRFLPAILIMSTIAGAVCMVSLQLPFLHDLLHSNALGIIFGLLYSLTLSCMAYCMLFDPGQMEREPSVLPDRAHKTWLYAQPINRYDHYCRWLMNCIGLMNHREFLIMLIGLVTIAVAGACVDVALLIVEVRTGPVWPTAIAISLHLVYSIVNLIFIGQILKMHIGFVCRNELCAEWKEDFFWRVQPTSVFNGKMLKDMNAEEILKFEEGSQLSGMIVSQLSVETYNAMQHETNLYDPSLNKYDHGWSHNCWTFWLTPRRTKSCQSVF